jgi:drug/metabolite transporter (DMT)-like permease
MTYAVACCAIGMVRLVLYLLHYRQYNTAPATKSKSSIMKVSNFEWKSGIQLGLLIAIAATLQSLGLQRTTAIRAGFLVRLSTIFVPLIDSLYIQRKLPSKVMIGALMSSLVGVLLMVLSPTTTTVGTGSILLDGTIMNSSTTWVGDILVALSAVFYSTHILRLGVLAPKCNPMSLSITKSLTQLIISQLLLLFSLLVTTIKSFSSSSSSSLLSSSIGQQSSIKNIPPISYRIALYTGSVTCAFPMYAQGYGQQYIKSSYASLIYATAPVWNAIIAAVILKERLNTRGMMGAGFLIIGMISAIVASVRDRSD